MFNSTPKCSINNISKLDSLTESSPFVCVKLLYRCQSCHWDSEVRNVACWSHISTHPLSPLSCSDRSLQCVWCTFLSTALSALVIDSCGLHWAVHYMASQAPHPITGCSSLTGWGWWPGGGRLGRWSAPLLVFDVEPGVSWIYTSTPMLMTCVKLLTY